MLSIFPELLIYNFLGIALVRIALGIFFFFLFAKILIKKDLFILKLKSAGVPFSDFLFWPLPILTILVGNFILIGFYTQAAVLGAIFILLKLSIIDTGENKPLGNNFFVYFFAALISLALLFLGAGAFAFDLPL